MEERKFIKLKKEEYGIKEYIKRDLGKGKISRLDIEYTPVGEKIIVYTARPGLVIGRRGEKIDDLTTVLKKKFKLENPHIEIREIEFPLFDAQLVADDIALALERMGNLKFKVIAYKKLQEIMRAGALGCELRLSGKLPSDRAKSWRFAEGYLKKAGESSKEINRAQATALTKLGISGIKVAIMPPTARIYDRIEVNDAIRAQIRTIIPTEKITAVAEKKKVKITVKKVKLAKEDASSTETLAEAAITHVKKAEDGTAMAIEQELEEGVPQDIIDAEQKEKNKEKKTEKKTVSENIDKITKPKKSKKLTEREN
ncbi:MAG: 30S ribosomal protein S3 [Nanoarchaeota archaeon]